MPRFMNIRVLISGLAFAGIAACATGCRVRVVEGPPPAYSETTYEASAEPPPPQVEVITVRPSPEHVWVHGHWVWYGGRWHWRAGYWRRERVGCVWVAGHWERGPYNWRWVPGHCA